MTVDECLWLPTENGAYGPVESAHALLSHILTNCLAQASGADASEIAGPGNGR